MAPICYQALSQKCSVGRPKAFKLQMKGTVDCTLHHIWHIFCLSELSFTRPTDWWAGGWLRTYMLNHNLWFVEIEKSRPYKHPKNNRAYRLVQKLILSRFYIYTLNILWLMRYYIFTHMQHNRIKAKKYPTKARLLGKIICWGTGQKIVWCHLLGQVSVPIVLPSLFSSDYWGHNENLLRFVQLAVIFNWQVSWN